MIVFHSESFAAQRFGVAKPLFRQRRQQSSVGEVERVLGGHAQGFAGVLQGIVGAAIAEELQAFFEIVHSGIRGRRGANPVGHSSSFLAYALARGDCGTGSA